MPGFHHCNVVTCPFIQSIFDLYIKVVDQALSVISTLIHVSAFYTSEKIVFFRSQNI